MKANRLNILEIKSKGEETISSTRHKLNYFAFFSSLTMFFLNVNIDGDLLGVLISALAIFTGFFFTLIVYITDKSVSKLNLITEEQRSSSLFSQLRKNVKTRV